MSRHTLLFLIPSPLKNAHTSKTRNCFSIFVFPSRYSSPSLSPSLFSSLFLRIFKSSLIFVWNEYRISNWWPQSTAKPSFISTFWLAISQGQARFGRSFHSTKTSVVTSKNKIWSPWFSASIDIPRFVNFSPGPYSRLHTCIYIYMCVYVSVASTIAPPFSGYSFCLKEERERKENAEPRLAPGYHGSSGSSFCPALSDGPIDRLGRLRTGFLRSNAIETRLDYYFCIFTRAFVATTASIGPPIREATGNVASSLELAYFLLSFSRIFGVDRSFDRFLR